MIELLMIYAVVAAVWMIVSLICLSVAVSMDDATDTARFFYFTLVSIAWPLAILGYLTYQVVHNWHQFTYLLKIGTDQLLSDDR